MSPSAPSPAPYSCHNLRVTLLFPALFPSCHPQFPHLCPPCSGPPPPAFPHFPAPRNLTPGLRPPLPTSAPLLPGPVHPLATPSFCQLLLVLASPLPVLAGPLPVLTGHSRSLLAAPGLCHLPPGLPPTLAAHPLTPPGLRPPTTGTPCPSFPCQCPHPSAL